MTNKSASGGKKLSLLWCSHDKWKRLLWGLLRGFKKQKWNA